MGVASEYDCEATEKTAFGIASTEALHLVNRYGLFLAEAMMRGYVAAFALSLSAMIGPTETRKFIDETLPRPQPAKPKLVAS